MIAADAQITATGSYWQVETQMEKLLNGTRDRKQEIKLVEDEQWKCEDRQNITAQIFGEQRSSTPSAKNNTKVCFCLSRPTIFIFLCLSKVVDSFHTLFLSPQRQLRRVLANKLCINKSTDDVLCDRHFSSR